MNPLYMFDFAAFSHWLETMRSPGGYGGPVAHWWQQSLMFCGAGFDWRYEGIIAGYLALWRRTDDEQWLRMARQAGDDLVNAQRDDGHFLNSGFERNPSTAGTPHEAACNIGLLLLADALEEGGVYQRCAEKNLRQFYIEQLWDASHQRFCDGVGTDTFVPNKAATACEAFFLLARLRQEDRWVEQYVLPTLESVIEHQIVTQGRLHGGIAQNSIGRKRIDKLFPIYIARCVPALLQANEWTGDEHYLNTAQNALAFIERWQHPMLPTVIYSDETSNRSPAWVAGLGDVLRAGELGRAAGLSADFTPLQHQLQQDSTGAFQTAQGFAAQAGGARPTLPDVRDVLHVVGWNDKAFRYLAQYAELVHTSASPALFECDCIFRGKQVKFMETAQKITMKAKRETVYQWRKGTPYPQIASADFWLR
ncbi:MAG: hypothetical protein ACPG8W_00980 [Candidatus Promineifilaceae bacterium]